MPSLLAKMKVLLIIEESSSKIEVKRCALFHIKTRVSLRYFVSYCREHSLCCFTSKSVVDCSGNPKNKLRYIQD